jgi:NAD(P)-dependent dehydrogenase (short-subunit alcohol dehydrogenase family)
MRLFMAKTVIIVVSSGMGLASAKALQDKGHEIIIASRSKEKLEKAAQQIEKATTYSLDFTQEEDLLHFFQSIGFIDHLVITSASFVMGPFLKMPTQDAKDFFDHKFWGQYLAAKIGAPFIRQGGSITFFCGIAGHKPFQHFAAGSAINAAIEGLTRALALELSPLRVNAISPGTIVTPVWDSVPEKERKEEFEQTAQRLPVKKVGQPEDVAKAVIFLIECGYASGSIVYVDGGALII